MANQYHGLFGGDSDIKLNSKWNINTFLANPGNYRSTSSSSLQPANGGSTLSSDLKLELDRSIKAIEMAYSKSTLDFDKIFRDLATRRKELKALMAELQATARPADLAALWGVESNLIVNQLRALENKQKNESEKFKHIRDEKKLIRDKMGNDTGTGTNNGVTNIITNNPLSAAEGLTKQAASPMGYNIGTIASDAIIKPSEMFKREEPETIEFKPSPTVPPLPAKSEEPVMEETTAEQTVVKAPSISKEEPMKPTDMIDGDVVVQSTMTGVKPITVSDIQSNINSKLAERMAQRDNILSDVDTITGYNYQHSLDAITSKSQPHVEKLFICPATGEYYVKAYGKDSNGEFTREIPNFPLKSITHIGQLSLNPLHKKAQFYYYPDAKDYVLVENMDDAPQFYKDEWSDHKTDKFKLDFDTCQSLIDAE